MKMLLAFCGLLLLAGAPSALGVLERQWLCIMMCHDCSGKLTVPGFPWPALLRQCYYLCIWLANAYASKCIKISVQGER